MEKERNYMFDTFRGLLMWSIPISHFTRVAGDFEQDSLSGFIYITINVFVMQAFMFLSGYFSKKPDRARQTAFKTFLWPLILSYPLFYVIENLFGEAKLDLTTPPFALWYLFVLFFYRFFLKDYIKYPKTMLTVSIILYLAAGQIPFFEGTFALGRMVSYFPFFLLGVFCTKERLESLQCLKPLHIFLLSSSLVLISCILAYEGKLPVGYYLLKQPSATIQGVSPVMDIIGRIMIFILACSWIILMLNILPKGQNFVSYVGNNTMPIYIMHIPVRYVIRAFSVSFGLFEVHNDTFIYYLLILGLASLCVLVFSSKPVAKGYNFVIDKTYIPVEFIYKKSLELIKKTKNRK